MSNRRRRKKKRKYVRFTEKDDEMLLTEARKFKKIPWTKISREIFDEKYSPGQLFQRYHRVLMPDRSEWTEEEDEKLIELYNEVGSRWSEIARRLGSNRCDVWCRQRYHTLIARRKKNPKTPSPKKIIKKRKREKEDNIEAETRKRKIQKTTVTKSVVRSTNSQITKTILTSFSQNSTSTRPRRGLNGGSSLHSNSLEIRNIHPQSMDFPALPRPSPPQKIYLEKENNEKLSIPPTRESSPHRYSTVHGDSDPEEKSSSNLNMIPEPPRTLQELHHQRIPMPEGPVVRPPPILVERQFAEEPIPFSYFGKSPAQAFHHPDDFKVSTYGRTQSYDYCSVVEFPVEMDMNFSPFTASISEPFEFWNLDYTRY